MSGTDERSETASLNRRRFVLQAAAGLGAVALPLPAAAQAHAAAWQRWVDAGWKAYEQAKDYPAAEQCFLQARSFGALRPWEYWALRKSIAHQGRYREALVAAAEGWQRHRDGRSALNLAEAHYETGDAATARRWLATMLEVPAPEKERRDLVESAEYRRMALLDVEIVATFRQANLEPPGRERFSRLGYYECYVPTEVPFQSCKVGSVAGGRSEEVTDRAGNRWLRLRPEGDGPVRVTMLATRKPMVFRPESLPMTRYTVPAEHQWLLKPAWGIDPTTETVARIVAKVKTPELMQTVRNVMAWWKAHVTHYDTVPKEDAERRNRQVGPVKASSDFPLRGGCTRCGGITEAMCAVFRGCGIAARWNLGLHHPGSPAGWHTWPEIYLGAAGWVPADDGLPFGELHAPLRLCHAMPERANANANGEIFWAMNGDLATREVRRHL
jgi:hypothetical protein